MFEEARVAIERLHDRESDRADVSERFLRGLERLLHRRVATEGILTEFSDDLLEPFVAPPAVRVGLPAIRFGLPAVRFS